MVLIDPRTGSKELESNLQREGLETYLEPLDFGDFAFEGNGPESSWLVGVERKTLTDLVSCIGSSRYIDHQVPGLVKMYKRVYLVVEGVYKRGFAGEILAPIGNSWVVPKGCYSYSYDMVERYLIGIKEHTGIPYIKTRDKQATAHFIFNYYHYYRDKQWDEHSTFKAFRRHNDLMSPNAPTDLMRMLHGITGLGWEISNSIEKHVGSIEKLCLLSVNEMAELDINGKRLGPSRAQELYNRLRGIKDAAKQRVRTRSRR